MKFDYCIGNPPYQEDNKDNNRQPPVYNYFLDAAYEVSDKVEMIHPARFLFDAGQTPKAWNKKMLEDEHLKVLEYESDASKIFAETEIKGGVAITYHSNKDVYGAIGVYTIYEELNAILRKVKVTENDNFSIFAYPKSTYGFTNVIYEEHPDYKARLTKGNEYIIDANIFEKIPEMFNENGDIKVYGRNNNSRVERYTKQKYIKTGRGVDKYKVFVTGVNGAGKFGEVLSTPFVGKPNEVATQTYMSFGFFDTLEEANNLLSYIKTKFARCLLSVLKVTHNNPRDCWRMIPSQDFTSNSDIDWSKSIREIDIQLYKKYGLTPEEVDFIENNVKEMV